MERYYDFASDGKRNHPVVNAALGWLYVNDPKIDEDEILNWGDARVPNVIYGEDLEVRALLDWEMMSLSSPEMEVAYVIWGQRHHTEGLGVPQPDGFLTPEETISYYERATGRSLRHVLDYYEPLWGTHTAILFMRLAKLMIAAGTMTEETSMAYNNPSTKLLSKMLGLPDSGAPVQDWVGRREPSG
jgi:aminoglycoside phosphotransferase (APT) family kinase protein